jgi:hypothetical protein
VPNSHRVEQTLFRQGGRVASLRDFFSKRGRWNTWPRQGISKKVCENCYPPSLILSMAVAGVSAPGAYPILFSTSTIISPPEIRGGSLSRPCCIGQSYCRGGSYWLQGGLLCTALTWGTTPAMPLQDLSPAGRDEHLCCPRNFTLCPCRITPRPGLYRG